LITRGDPVETAALLLLLTLPPQFPDIAWVRIERLYVREGEPVTAGAKLLDLVVDLSETFAHDCPPQTRFVLIARDQGWLRRWDVKAGDNPPISRALALLSKLEDEALEPLPGRDLRVSVVGAVASGWDWT
jgi:hypothetical protein